MFLGGCRPDAEDACVFAAASSLPLALLRAAPAVKGWLNTVGMFAPSMRAGWGGGVSAAGAKAAAPTAKASAQKGSRGTDAVAPAAAKARAAKAEDGDDVDSLFGDDDEEAGGGAAEASGAESRAQQMAAVKAGKDKKKVDRCGSFLLQSGVM